jgi:CPA1 family monovalent cation:H+ antiporter
MAVIELVLALLAVTAMLEVTAKALRLPLPALLVIAGVVVALTPGVPRPELDPEAVFLVFIPPLLYWTAFTSSLRDFRKWMFSISTLGIGLVLVTMAAVAVVAHALVPELTWPAAFVLGAIVSPPDTVAALAATRHLSIPKAIITILEGEGLVNDATAIVSFRMAIAAAVSSVEFSLGRASVNFFVAAVGGVAVGLGVGILVSWARKLVGKAPTVEATLSLLTPFFAFLPAEKIEASGVLAVVACGLYLGRTGPKVVSAQSRVQAAYMWRMITFLLEGLIFLLVGLELPLAFVGLEHHPLWELIVWALAVSATAIVVRLLWMYPGALLARIIRYPFAGWMPLPRWQEAAFAGWAGIRGGDSLVIALSLPLMTATGEPFPGRHVIIFLTFVVIVVTLVVIGLTLAPLAKLLRLGHEPVEETEERDARQKLFAAARTVFTGSAGAPGFVRTAIDVVVAQRRELIGLRDGGAIGDDVMQKLLHELDLEEILLESRPTAPKTAKPRDLSSGR